MHTYIATFFSHFGAIRFHKGLKDAGLSGTLMPVPRKVSSSCGTCVQFEAEGPPVLSLEDVEGLYCKDGEEFVAVVSNL